MKKELVEVFSRYTGKREEIMPILRDIQNVLGYLPKEAMEEAAGFLKVPASTIYGIATFYGRFYLTRQGKHRVTICKGTACHIRGGRKMAQTVKKKLGISPGETTEDYQFTLERVTCLGSCALAPVVVADKKVYGSMTTERMEQLIDSLSDNNG